jgi:hypothetical protein
MSRESPNDVLQNSGWENWYLDSFREKFTRAQKFNILIPYIL